MNNTTRPPQHSIAVVVEATRQLDMSNILSLLGISYMVRGNEFLMLNPTRQDAGFNSFSINAVSHLWCEFAEAGDKKARGRDVVSLTAYVRNCNNGEAANFLGQALGLTPPSHERTHQ